MSISLSASTPAAPAGKVNITWQADGLGNISGYVIAGVNSLTGDGTIVSNVLSTGAVTLTLATVAANKVLAGPTSGGAVVPTYRLLVAGDIPSLPASIITTGQLALARGGTNADLSATGAAHSFLKQSAVGAAVTVGLIGSGDVPSGVVTWDLLGNAAASLTLANAGFSTTFNQTSAVTWTWGNTTAATVTVPQPSPVLTVAGTYWTGAASATDSWSFQNVVGVGTNGSSTLTVTHAGTTAVPRVSLPGPIIFSTTLSATALGLQAGGVTTNGCIGLNISNASTAVFQLTVSGTTGMSITSGLTGGNDAGMSLSNYLGNATVGAGVVPIYAKSNLVTQSAAILATTIYAVPNTANRTRSGLYRISYSSAVTTAATTSSVLGGANGFQVLYTDVNDTVVKTSPVGLTSAGNTTGTMISGDIIVYAKAGTNIQYTYGYTSVGATVMVYDLNVYVEFLG